MDEGIEALNSDLASTDGRVEGLATSLKVWCSCFWFLCAVAGGAASVGSCVVQLVLVPLCCSWCW